MAAGNEKVEITVKDENSVLAVTTVEAVNVSPAELSTRVVHLLNHYQERSKAEGQLQSLGDFALFLVAESSVNP